MGRIGVAYVLLSCCCGSAFGQPIITRSGAITSPAAQPAYAIDAAGNARFSTVAGDASTVVIRSTDPHATQLRTASSHASDQASVADYVPAQQQLGGATSLTVLMPQAVGDASVQLSPDPTLIVGHHVAASGLAPTTTIVFLDAITTRTLSETTSAPTLTDAEQQALPVLTGMSNALTFATSFAVPMGAAVGGAGLPAGTTVVGSIVNGAGGETVYVSADVTVDVAASTPVTFSYASQTVVLSNSWTTPPAVGAGLGIYVQDDYPAFQNAIYWMAPEHGGPGGRIIVPSGRYFLSTTVTTYDGVDFVLGAGASFVSGSASIDAQDGAFPATSDISFLGGGRNQTPTELNVSQVIEQRLMPDLQGQAVLVNQNNASCTNDGSGWGCGMVGIEVKQSHDANIDSGVLWEYHGTDTVTANQDVTWAGAELELLNNSGLDVKWNGGKGNKTGLHIDDLGNTDNTVALLPGNGGTGKWHRALDCTTAAVRDYCWDVQTAPIAADGTPTLLATLDVSGNASFATVKAAGSIIATPAAASYVLQQSDCGSTLEPQPSTPMTIRIPTGLAPGCQVTVDEVNAVQISFAAGSGETMRSLNGASRISANYGSATILIDGSSTFFLSGNIQ